MKNFILITLVSSSGVLHAANVEPIRDIACPEIWVGKVIPVISSATSPWGDDPVDRARAKTHLSTMGVVETIDAVPVTNDHLVDDSLTVASECLVYKNMLVDGEQYYPPSPSVPRNTETGFIPASIF